MNRRTDHEIATYSPNGILSSGLLTHAVSMNFKNVILSEISFT